MNDIKDKLSKAAELAAGNELERDLALDILREVYSEIKFGCAETAEAVVVAGTVATEEGRSEPAAEESVPDSAGEGLEPEPDPEPKPEPELLPEPELVREEPRAGFCPEREPLSDPEPVQETRPVIPRPVAPDVIRSLYGGAAEPVPEPAEISSPAPSFAYTSVPASARKPVTTLGDAIGAGRQTLGEALRHGEKDLATLAAEKFAATQAAGPAAGRPSLKKSIGLNDRLLMIRDMFGGDSGAFDRSIEQLDAFTDLDDAIIHIHDTYDWSADSPGVRLLVELLERKLG